jgi:hypothetical protein
MKGDKLPIRVNDTRKTASKNLIKSSIRGAAFLLGGKRLPAIEVRDHDLRRTGQRFWPEVIAIRPSL